MYSPLISAQSYSLEHQKKIEKKKKEIEKKKSNHRIHQKGSFLTWKPGGTVQLL